MPTTIIPAYDQTGQEAATFQLGDARRNGKGIGNCVVLAVTAATGLDYAEVEKAMTLRGGYTEGRGTQTSRTNLNKALNPLGFRVDKAHSGWHGSTEYYGDDNRRNNKTQDTAPKTFWALANKEKGAWLACNNGHGVAIIDGELIDNGYHIPKTERYTRCWGKRRQLKQAYRIVPITTDGFTSRGISTSNPGTQTSLF